MSKVKASDMEASHATSEVDVPSKRARTTAHDNSAVDASASASADKLSPECLLCKVQDPAYQVPHDHTLLDVLSRFVDDMTIIRKLLIHIVMKIMLSLPFMLDQKSYADHLMLRRDDSSYQEQVQEKIKKLYAQMHEDLETLLSLSIIWLEDIDDECDTLSVEIQYEYERKVYKLINAVCDRVEQWYSSGGGMAGELGNMSVMIDDARMKEQLAISVQDVVAHCDLADVEAKISIALERFAARAKSTARLDGQHVHQALHTSLCICLFVSHFAGMYYGPLISPFGWVHDLSRFSTSIDTRPELPCASSEITQGMSINTSQDKLTNLERNAKIHQFVISYRRALMAVNIASERFTYAMKVLRDVLAAYKEENFPSLVHKSFMNLLDMKFAASARKYVDTQHGGYVIANLNELLIQTMCEFAQVWLAESGSYEKSTYPNE